MQLLIESRGGSWGICTSTFTLFGLFGGKTYERKESQSNVGKHKFVLYLSCVSVVLRIRQKAKGVYFEYIVNSVKLRDLRRKGLETRNNSLNCTTFLLEAPLSYKTFISNNFQETSPEVKPFFLLSLSRAQSRQKSCLPKAAL
jgi:hypothetical protein